MSFVVDYTDIFTYINDHCYRLSLSDSADLCWISVDCSYSRDLLHLQETQKN